MSAHTQKCPTSALRPAPIVPACMFTHTVFPLATPCRAGMKSLAQGSGGPVSHTHSHSLCTYEKSADCSQYVHGRLRQGGRGQCPASGPPQSSCPSFLWTGDPRGSPVTTACGQGLLPREVVRSWPENQGRAKGCSALGSTPWGLPKTERRKPVRAPSLPPPPLVCAQILPDGERGLTGC